MTASSLPRSSRSRKRICLLLDTVQFAYQNELLLGVHEQCVNEGLDLYCLSARVGDSLYDLVGPTDYDGIIMSTGTMVHDEATLDLQAFVAKFGATPTVSMSTAVPNVTSVIIDNVSSVRELTKHLIEAHGKRRIGFVRVNSPEGEQRFEGYQEALFDHGISLDPALVVMGEFTWEAGEEAVRVLFDERKAGCDAIMGSNDWIAMGAMRALEARGVKVPRDVAVTGFDDVEDARFADPPLTSVSQPVRELGAEATRLLLNMMRGERVPMVKPIRTKLKLRQSCGCGLPKSKGMGSLSPGWEGPASASHVPWIERWANTMRRASPRSTAQLEDSWANDLALALDGDLASQTEDAFLAKVAVMVNNAAEFDSVPEWHDVIQALRASCVPCLREDSQRWVKAESLFERAHLLVAAVAERVQGQRRIELQELLTLLNEISREVRSLHEESAVTRVLAVHLSRLRIPSFYLGRAPRRLDPDAEASLLLAYDVERGSRVLEELPFRAGEWVPVDLRPRARHTMIVQQLVFGEGASGFCVAEMGPTVGIVYESVREMLNSSLQNARLLHLLAQAVAKFE
jgi:DNA-binding LacI/PurR family transcriptional regulator